MLVVVVAMGFGVVVMERWVEPGLEPMLGLVIAILVVILPLAVGAAWRVSRPSPTADNGPLITRDDW